MYSSSSKTFCFLATAPASAAARFLPGPDAVESNRARGDALGVSIAIPGLLRRRVTASEGRDCAGCTSASNSWPMGEPRVSEADRAPQ